MSNYAVIKDNKVENIIVWDGETPFEIEGAILVRIPEDVFVTTGYSYDNQIFFE